MFSWRSIIFILQALSLVTPLFGKGRRQKLPLLLKEGMFFVITNWDVIWKHLEKRNWSIQTIKNILKFNKFRK